MPHLNGVDWDYADQMQHCDLGGGGDVWFVYDATGQRVRKVWANQAGSLVKERIYLGPYEVYREHKGSPMIVDLERETLHVNDDTGRICMVETKTVENGSTIGSPTSKQRFQYSNHLGTAALEVDENGGIICYEEFHPFGSTSYQAKNSGIDVSPKRYRYTGKERDDETGLYYHGARYYACWLGRWTAADPIGLQGGINRYRYSSSNPVNRVDPSGTLDLSWDNLTEAASDVYDGAKAKVESAATSAADKVVEVASDPGGAVVGYYEGLGDGVVAYGEALGEHGGAILSSAVEGFYDVTTHKDGIGAGLAKKGREVVEASVGQMASDVVTVLEDGYAGTAQALAEGDLSGAIESYSEGAGAAWRLAEVVAGGIGAKSLLKGKAPKGAGRGRSHKGKSVSSKSGKGKNRQNKKHAKKIVGEAADAMEVKVEDLVDKIEFGKGDSFFEVVGGKRTLSIGSHALQRSPVGQVLEGIHELTHALQFDDLVKRFNGNVAKAEAKFNNVSPKREMWDEMVAERNARLVGNRKLKMSKADIAETNKWLAEATAQWRKL